VTADKFGRQALESAFISVTVTLACVNGERAGVFPHPSTATWATTGLNSCHHTTGPAPVSSPRVNLWMRFESAFNTIRTGGEFLRSRNRT
jgi:hypothetical protein